VEGHHIHWILDLESKEASGIHYIYVRHWPLQRYKHDYLLMKCSVGFLKEKMAVNINEMMVHICLWWQAPIWSYWCGKTNIVDIKTYPVLIWAVQLAVLGSMVVERYGELTDDANADYKCLETQWEEIGNPQGKNIESLKMACYDNTRQKLRTYHSKIY